MIYRTISVVYNGVTYIVFYKTNVPVIGVPHEGGNRESPRLGTRLGPWRGDVAARSGRGVCYINKPKQSMKSQDVTRYSSVFEQFDYIAYFTIRDSTIQWHAVIGASIKKTTLDLNGGVRGGCKGSVSRACSGELGGEKPQFRIL